MDLYIYGAGGNGKELYHILVRQKLIKNFENVYYIDRKLIENSIYGKKIFSIEEVIQRTDKNNFQVIISPSEPKIRIEMSETLSKNGIALYSNVQDEIGYSKLGKGVVDWGCTLLADGVIGDACLLGTNAVISHDVEIGKGSHIGCNVFIGGGCKIGKGVLIGPGAVIRHNIKIGDYATIGMGSTVLKNVPPQSLVMGSSASVVLRNRSINNFGD